MIYNWPHHCCGSHAQSDEKTRQNYINTCLDKYGAINTFQVQEFKDKAVITMLSHGYDHPMHNNEIKEKLKNTLKLIYGEEIENAFQLQKVIDKNKQPEIKQKRLDAMQRTNMEKYGVPWYFISDEFYNQCGVTNGTSKIEKELADYIKSITTEDIILNSFKVISPKQLDIYIPSLKIAFEFNGTYYHSIEYLSNKDKTNIDYHLQKTIACENLGIKLIHIWEDEWINKKDDVKNFIKLLIDGKYVISHSSDIIEVDRSKFNKAWNIPGYVFIGETKPKIILRSKKDKLKYKVPDCGTLIYRKI